MSENELLKRITCTPSIMAGKPVVKGTRLTVERILSLLAQDVTIDEIKQEYKGLETEDVQACLLFASKCLSDISFMPLEVETV